MIKWFAKVRELIDDKQILEENCNDRVSVTRAWDYLYIARPAYIYLAVRQFTEN